jgi:nickel-dependent lactate racemase
MKIGLPELIWYGNTTLEIDLPDDWEVEFCPMRGAKRKPLTIDEMKKAIGDPIGSPGIKELTKGKKSAVVIFDDITRPTRVYEIAPFVIGELMAGGLAEEDITLVCALGTHGAHTNHEFRKKLGSDILERFRVYNHNPYANCIEVGTSTRGTRLLVNREVMEADLKIGIGCVTAHQGMGFSGGGKIIMPGVSHIDSIAYNHGDVKEQAPETCAFLGDFDDNVVRLDSEECARMAGLDFKIDVLVNDRGATTALFAGDFQEEHAQAVALAKDLYATEPRPRNKDLVISNAFAKANEMPVAVVAGALALENLSGTTVIIANAPEGQVTHYLLRTFGRDYGGPLYPTATIPPSLNLILVNPYHDKTATDWVANPEAFTCVKNWESALRILRESYKAGTRVAVVPNATMQYYDS